MILCSKEEWRVAHGARSPEVERSHHTRHWSIPNPRWICGGICWSKHILSTGHVLGILCQNTWSKKLRHDSLPDPTRCWMWAFLGSLLMVYVPLFRQCNSMWLGLLVYNCSSSPLLLLSSFTALRSKFYLCLFPLYDYALLRTGSRRDLVSN